MSRLKFDMETFEIVIIVMTSYVVLFLLDIIPDTLLTRTILVIICITTFFYMLIIGCLKVLKLTWKTEKRVDVAGMIFLIIVVFLFTGFVVKIYIPLLEVLFSRYG